MSTAEFIELPSTTTASSANNNISRPVFPLPTFGPNPNTQNQEVVFASAASIPRAQEYGHNERRQDHSLQIPRTQEYRQNARQQDYVPAAASARHENIGRQQQRTQQFRQTFNSHPQDDDDDESQTGEGA